MKYTQEFITVHGKGLIDSLHCSSGIFIWININKKIDIEELVMSLNSKNIIVVAGKNFYENESCRINALRLCIYNLTNESIRSGLVSIIDEIDNTLVIT